MDDVTVFLLEEVGKLRHDLAVLQGKSKIETIQEMKNFVNKFLEVAHLSDGIKNKIAEKFVDIT